MRISFVFTLMIAVGSALVWLGLPDITPVIGTGIALIFAVPFIALGRWLARR